MRPNLTGVIGFWLAALWIAFGIWFYYFGGPLLGAK
jgi:hypothetical protein